MTFSESGSRQEKGNQEPAASPAVAFETAQEEKKVAPEIEKDNGQDEELASSDAPASDPQRSEDSGGSGDFVREESPTYNPNSLTDHKTNHLPPTLDRARLLTDDAPSCSK